MVLQLYILILVLGKFFAGRSQSLSFPQRPFDVVPDEYDTLTIFFAASFFEHAFITREKACVCVRNCQRVRACEGVRACVYERGCVCLCVCERESTCVRERKRKVWHFLFHGRCDIAR